MFKVLVVDDEKYVRQNVINSLDWTKFNLQIVAQAENGQVALQKLEEFKPNIIITDIKMPLIDGISLIKLVKDKYPNIYFIILSGYDDFKYTKEAIKLGVDNYIKKPIEEKELEETLIEIVRKIEAKNNIFEQTQNAKILINNNQLIQLIHNRVLNSGLQADLNQKLYAILIINYYQLNVSNISTNTLLKLSNEYLQSVTAENIITFIFEDSLYEKTISILLNGNSLNSYLLRGLICFIKEHLRLKDITIASSSIFEVFSNIPEKYENTILLLKSILINSTDVLIGDYEKISLNKKFNEAIYTSLNLINQSIEDRRFNQANIALNRIFNDKNKGLFSIELLEAVISNLGNTLKKLILLYDIPTKFIRLNPVFNSNFLLQFSDFNELQEYFNTLASEIFSKLPDMSDVTIINKILLFITTHYNTELTLTSVSSEFYLNSSYLSALFKNKTGVNFSSFIEDLRIKKAMELLQDPNAEISDISNEVGYSDPNYFSKIFKKRVGLSPSKFSDANSNSKISKL